MMEMETKNDDGSTNAPRLPGMPIPVRSWTSGPTTADLFRHTPTSFPSITEQTMPSLHPPTSSKVDSVQGRVSPIAHLHNARAGTINTTFKRPPPPPTTQVPPPMRPPPPRPSTSSPPPPQPTPPPPPPPEVIAATRLGFSASELGAIVEGAKREAFAARELPRVQSVLAIPGLDGSYVLLDREGQFLKLIQNITINERKLMKRRLAIVGRKNDLRAQLPLYHAAQEEFAQFFEAAVQELWDSDLSPARKNQLQQAWTKTEKLSQTVEKWQELLEHEEDDELLKLESKCLANQIDLMKLLADFYPHNALDKEVQYTDTLSDTIKPGDASRPPSVSSRSSDDPEPSRLRYLEAVGTINILRDHMFNLQSDLRVHTRQRNQALNAGHALEQSVEDFYADFRSRRQDLVNEYWTTKEEMDKAFQDCLAEGLDVLPANLPEDNDQLFSNQDDGFVASNRPEDPYRLSEFSMNIARWSRHVTKMSLPESLHLHNMIMTDKEAEELLPFPNYAHLQVSTAMDEPSAPASGSCSPQRRTSFIGDRPASSRRYSAPMVLESTDHNRDRLVLDYQTFKTRKLNARRRQHRPVSRRANTEI